MSAGEETGFGRPRRSAAEQLAGGPGEEGAGALAERAPGAPSQPFRPLPKPTGKPPFRLKLEKVIGSARTKAIERDGVIVFHTFGDSGGVKSPQPQEIVAHVAGA